MKSLSYLNNTSVLILVHFYYSATIVSTRHKFRSILRIDLFFLSNL